MFFEYFKLLGALFMVEAKGYSDQFLPHDVMATLARYMLSSCVCQFDCLSVCVSVARQCCMKNG